MNRLRIKTIRRARRKTGLRKRIIGTPDRPRMSVFRSLKHLYVQVIDDLSGRTLASASTVDKDLGATGNNKGSASVIGKAIAERAKSAGVEKVVFDRNGYRYHGRVQVLADAAREGGLKF